MTNRKKPGWAFWTTVALVAVMVAYPLSFGPACWWSWHGGMDIDYDRDYSSEDFEPRAPIVYWPLGWMAVNGPAPIGRSICWYATIGAPRIHIPADALGGTWLLPN